MKEIVRDPIPALKRKGKKALAMALAALMLLSLAPMVVFAADATEPVRIQGTVTTEDRELGDPGRAVAGASVYLVPVPVDGTTKLPLWTSSTTVRDILLDTDNLARGTYAQSVATNEKGEYTFAFNSADDLWPVTSAAGVTPVTYADTEYVIVIEQKDYQTNYVNDSGNLLFIGRDDVVAEANGVYNQTSASPASLEILRYVLTGQDATLDPVFALFGRVIGAHDNGFKLGGATLTLTKIIFHVDSNGNEILDSYYRDETWPELKKPAPTQQSRSVTTVEGRETEGEFLFEGLWDGNYELKIERDGYVTRTVVIGNSNEAGSEALKYSDGSANVVGEAPLWKDKVEIVITSAGTYDDKGTEIGTYELDEEEYLLDVLLAAEGRVVDDKTGAPVEGATVRIVFGYGHTGSVNVGAGSFTTTASGEFLIGGGNGGLVPGGMYHLVVTHPEYQTYAQSFIATLPATGTKVTLPANINPARLIERVSVTGSVRALDLTFDDNFKFEVGDERNWKGVADAVVTAYEVGTTTAVSSATTTLSEDGKLGTFELKGLEENVDYYIKITHDGYQTYPKIGDAVKTFRYGSAANIQAVELREYIKATGWVWATDEGYSDHVVDALVEIYPTLDDAEKGDTAKRISADTTKNSSGGEANKGKFIVGNLEHKVEYVVKITHNDYQTRYITGFSVEEDAVREVSGDGRYWLVDIHDRLDAEDQPSGWQIQRYLTLIGRVVYEDAAGNYIMVPGAEVTVNAADEETGEIGAIVYSTTTREGVDIRRGSFLVDKLENNTLYHLTIKAEGFLPIEEFFRMGTINRDMGNIYIQTPDGEVPGVSEPGTVGEAVRGSGLLYTAKDAAGNEIVGGLDAANANTVTVATMEATLSVSSPYSVKILNADGTEAAATDRVGTGMIVAILDADGNIVDQAPIVVFGDVSGDGLFDFPNDLYAIAGHFLGTGDELTGPYLAAADVNGDGIVNFLNDFYWLAGIFLNRP